MRTCLAFVVLLALGMTCLAGFIESGATMRVKPNSIWFEEAAQLARSLTARKRGNAKAFAAYQAKVLRQREAWQFIYELPVKILDYEPKKSRVHVEMGSEGRLAGSTWFLDVSALVR